MSDGSKISNRRTFLAGAGSVMIVGVFAGCNGGSGSGNGSANGTETGTGGGSGTSLGSETDAGSETTTGSGTAMGTETGTETTAPSESTTAGETDAETTAAEATNETDAASATENETVREADTERDEDNGSEEGGSERDRNRLTFGEIRQEPPSELDTLNQEYVELINASGSTNDLSGYTITYGDGATYTFDDGFELGVGDQVTVHTGSGDDSDTDVYVGRDSVALDYRGPDDVRVTDPSGTVVLETTA